MEDNMPADANGIADAVTAELRAGQAASAAPEPIAPAPVEAQPAAQQQEPAQASAERPMVFKARVQGQEIDVPLYDERGAINPKLVEYVQKAEDYTRKMQAIADERRRVQAYEMELKSAAAQAEAKAKLAALPQLPEDDPYSQAIGALRQQNEALAQHQMQVQEMLNQQLAERQQAEQNAALAAEEQRLQKEYGFGEREMTTVEVEFMRRASAGEMVTLDAIAKEYKGHIDALKEAAVKEWKEKHRVGSPAANVAAPAPGVPESLPLPGKPGFLEAILAEVGMRR